MQFGRGIIMLSIKNAHKYTSSFESCQRLTPLATCTTSISSIIDYIYK